jgi:hypothetical protein
MITSPLAGTPAVEAAALTEASVIRVLLTTTRAFGHGESVRLVVPDWKCMRQLNP